MTDGISVSVDVSAVSVSGAAEAVSLSILEVGVILFARPVDDCLKPAFVLKKMAVLNDFKAGF